MTADCPLIDPDILGRCVDALLTDPTLGYASPSLERTDSRCLDVQALTRTARQAAARRATESADREDVTRKTFRHPERFHLVAITDGQDHSHHRRKVDEPEDPDLVRRVYADLLPRDPHFARCAALAHANAQPDHHACQAHVEQKA